jgi:hypothetical protein
MKKNLSELVANILFLVGPVCPISICVIAESGTKLIRFYLNCADEAEKMMLYEGVLLDAFSAIEDKRLIEWPSNLKGLAGTSHAQLIEVAGLVQDHTLTNCSDEMLSISIYRAFNSDGPYPGWSITLQPVDLQDFEPGILCFEIIHGSKELTQRLLL